MFAAGVAACADILGIEDGIPRAYDASLDAPLDAAADVHDAATDDAAPDAAFSPLSCGTGTRAISRRAKRAAERARRRTNASTQPRACTGTYIPCDRPEQCPQNTEAGAKQCCTTDVLDDGGIYVAQSVGCVAEGKCTPIRTTTFSAVTTVARTVPPEAGCGPASRRSPPFLICKSSST